MGPLIFVVDNDPQVCRPAQECLEAAGYRVRAFPDESLAAEVKDQRPTLMLLGTSNRFAALRHLLRECIANGVHAIVLLDHAGEEQRLAALEAGADDCIVRPFSPRELVARVQAVLRRSGDPASAPHADTPDLVIDSWAMKLSVRGIEVPTTTLEFRLLEYMARHRGQVFTRDFLLDAVWGDMQFITPRSVDACIRRIREKIEPDRAKPTLLRTMRGVGYRLDAVVSWQSAVNEGCECSACRPKTTATRFYVAKNRRRTMAQR